MKKFIFILLFTNFSCLLGHEKFVIYIDTELVDLSRQIAINYVGVTENRGFNRSKEIDYLNFLAGAKWGSSYCCSSQFGCYEIASGILNVENPLPKVAVATQMFAFFKKNGKKVEYKPTLDDFIIWYYLNSWKGHIERIVEVLKGGWVITVAFNVSFKNETSNDGRDGVAYKKRNILHPLFRMRVKGLAGVR